MGTLASGRVAAYTALRHPDVFGKLAVRSISLEGASADEVLAAIGGPQRPALEVYLDWNRYEWRSGPSGYDRREDSKRLAETFETNGYRYAGGEAADSYGWASLRVRNNAMLRALFPLR